MIKINDAQAKAILRLDAKERYVHSLKMIADTEEMYSLLNSDENWELAEVENKVVFFLWPAKEYVVPFLQGEDWKNSSIEKITLDEFNDEIIPFLREKKILINVFSVNKQSGFVVSSDEFIRDLEEELEQYD